MSDAKENTPNGDAVEQAKASVEEGKKALTKFQEYANKVLDSTGFTKVLNTLRSSVPGFEKVTLEGIRKNVKAFFDILFNGVGGLTLLLLVIGAFQGLFYEKIIFGDFGVPNRYEESAITGNVLKTKILHEAISFTEFLENDSTTVGTRFSTKKRKSQITLKESDLPEQDITIMGISLNEILGFIRSSLRQTNTYISGNLIEHGEQLVLELNITNQEEREGEGADNSSQKMQIIQFPVALGACEGREMECLDSLIKEAGIHIAGLAQPLAIAEYYYYTDFPDRAKGILNNITQQKVVDEEGKKELAKARNLMGTIISDEAWATMDSLKNFEFGPIDRWRGVAEGTNMEVQKKALDRALKRYKDATAEFKRAAKINPFLLRALVNRADLLVEKNILIIDDLASLFYHNLDKDQKTAKRELQKKEIGEAIKLYEEADSLFQGVEEKEEVLNAPLYKEEAEEYLGYLNNPEEIDQTRNLPETDRFDLFDYQWYYRIGKQLLAEENYGEGLEAFARCLKYMREQKAYVQIDIDTNDQKLLLDLAITTQRTYCEGHINAGELRNYHRIIEHFAYINFWNVELFYLPQKRTLLKDFPIATEEPVYWPAYTLAPDPIWTGYPLDTLGESLFYYLFWDYEWEQVYEDSTNYFTAQEKYLDILQASDSVISDSYSYYHNYSYADWKVYRRQPAFRESLGENYCGTKGGER